MIDDIDHLLTEYARSKAAERNPIDRHREFSRVFLGSEEGKRVLADIVAWGNMWKSSIYAQSSDVTAAREGARRLVLQILATISVEPTDPPTQQGKEG